MTEKLLTFMRLLRDSGLRLSVAESLDALHSVSHIGLADRELLRLSLRTVLVKSHQDFVTFDTLFERFFTAPRRRRRRRGRQPTESGNSMGQPQTPQTDGPAGLTTPPEAQQPAHSAPQAARETSQAEAQPEATTTQTADAALTELAALQQAWQQQVSARSSTPLTPPAHEGTPLAHTRLDQPFPPDRLEDMYREVERLTMRLLTRRAVRQRLAHHGRLDFRRTVSHSLRNGSAVPFTLLHRRRLVSKLRLMVLCDVSGSVWQVSTFLLKLVHTLQSAFANVRSFVFVNSLVEITELFRGMRFPEDLETLRHYPNLNLFGFSDFGRTFFQFTEQHLGDLRRDTVVLILGDARNNAFDPQLWALEDIQQHCRSIIWLNPEPQRQWDTGDSILTVYAPYCTHVLECWTLEHLIQAADVLLQQRSH